MVKGSKESPEQRLRRAATSDADAVLNEYESRPEGHFNEELTTSRIKYGKNTVTNHNKHQVLKRLYRAFVNYFIIVLAVIDVLFMVLDPDIIYFIVLTTLIVVSGTVTFIQETRSSKAAAKLVSMVTTIITVVREDCEIEVDSKELVVGDIIILDTGDMIPADVRIIESNHLKVDQSALTGESNAVSKHAAPVSGDGSILSYDNLAFMGTSVVGGSARAVVVAVGDDTVFGNMAVSLSAKKPTTTYDKGSKAITRVLIKIMLLMVPPVFVIMVAKGFMEGSDDVVIEAVKYAITLAIGLMPEMLATIVSTNLAKGSIDMSKKKVIVKDVTAIQNFGAMDVLCSDKTGTLTQNRISVKDCSDLYGNSSHTVEMYACLNAKNLRSATNQIDWALQEYADEELDAEEIESYQGVGDVPFDFDRRRATVVVERGDGVDLMITKGAIPELLSISTAYLDQNRDIQPLDEAKVNEIMGMVEWYSTKGLRVLGVTYKYMPTGKKEFTEEDEGDQIFCGYVIFTDPVKTSAKQAIKDMAGYGIDVKVLTGDNEYVTRHVCEQIGIDVHEVLTGDIIDGMTDEELKEKVEDIHVFTSLTPDNKAAVVKALKANGHTVGLMGDGINDVLAMRNADVSISVDTGTDIAKETASMILLEKDLNVLKDGAIEGRKVYVNTIKYVKMIGSINFGYMFSLIVGALVFNFEPMGGAMILIFNLTNDLACLFTPWDKVEDEFVREPRKWDPVNLKQVMYHYGPMCCVTDFLSWTLFVFVFLKSVEVTGFEDFGIYNGMDAVLSGYRLGEVTNDGDFTGLLNIAVLFQSLWFIEQYWMQVWSIHIVRTNKLPFVQAWSAPILVVTTILALIFGTVMPFTGDLWARIADIDVGELLSIDPVWLIWMPIVAVIYFSGAHLIKRWMLKHYGYFAC